MKSSSALKILFAFTAITSVAGAQERAPLRQLGPVVSKSTEAIGPVVTLRPLGNGVVLNDIMHRRVLQFDSNLATFTVVADTTPATGNAYSTRAPGSLIGFKGDSSLFLDPQTMSMLVIDGSGKIARVMSVPRSQDAMSLSLPGVGYDGRGHLIYRGAPIPRMPAFGPNGPTGAPEFPDSVPVMRIDLASRVLDTLTWMHIQKIKMDITRNENGGMSIVSQINPLPVIDEMSVLPDGSVALIRGKDYHVDFVRPDGTRFSAAKIPFDWQRLTDEDKIAFIDSMKVARARLGSAAPTVSLGSGGGPQVLFGGGGGAGTGGGPQINIQIGGGPGGPGSGARTATSATPPQMNFVPATELPDYKPAFFAGAVRSDALGNIWIRTIPTKSIPGGPVYDVIDTKGALVERVQIPVGSSIAGFGPNGSVYLLVRDGENSYLQKATVK